MFSATLVPKNMREVLSSVEGISFIKSSVKENINLSRAQLVKIICHKYHLISPDGRYQRSGCNSVLISLESQNKITLPKPRAGKKKKFVSMKRLNEEVPLPSSMPASIDQLDEPLKIILIEKEDAHLKLIWNELIATEHPQGGKKSIKMNYVYAREENPPEGVEKIEWKLLTTLPILTAKDALECIQYYKYRWRIEEYHRVLKTCCKIEKLKNNHGDDLKLIIAINLVIA